MADVATLGIKIESGDIKTAEDALDRLETQAGKTEKATTKMGSTTKKAAGSFKMMKGATQQLGYQVQDIAVQLGAGQSAMLVLGQQGSQIASIFGPGGAVIGAVIAVASAIGGTLVASLFAGSDALKDFKENFESLKGSLKSTGLEGFSSEVLGAMARIEAGALKTTADALTKLKTELKEPQAILDAAIRQQKALNVPGASPVTQAAARKNRTEAQKNVDILIAKQGRLNQDYQKSYLSLIQIGEAQSKLATGGEFEYGDSQGAGKKVEAANIKLATEAYNEWLDTLNKEGRATATAEAAAESHLLTKQREVNAVRSLVNPMFRHQQNVARLTELYKESGLPLKDYVAAINKSGEVLNKASEDTEEAMSTIESSISDSVTRSIMEFKSLGDAAKNVAKIIAQSIIKKTIADPFASFISGGIDNAVTSFDGGGFTGSGSRTGGIDGKGGMLSITHPNETVIDHTKGQQGQPQAQQVANITFNVQAFDSKSFSSGLVQHRAVIVGAVRDAFSRNGRPFPA